jgi:hypothetical protein
VWKAMAGSVWRLTLAEIPGLDSKTPGRAGRFQKT